MITAKLDVHLNKLFSLKQELSKTQLTRAYSAALNRSLSHAVSVIKREVRMQYKVPASILNSFPLFRANPTKLEGFVKAKTHPISLAHFDPRYEFTSGGKSFGVRIRTTKDGLSKTIKSKQRGSAKKGVSIEIKKGQRITIPYAFMTANNEQKPVFFRGHYKQGGSYGIVRRNKRVSKSGSDLPIAKMLSVSVYAMSINKRVSSNTQVDLSKYLMKRLEHELSVRVKKIIN